MSGSGGWDTEGTGGLVFPAHAGCAGSRDGHGSHPCTTPPVGTVKQRLERRRTVRLFVCEAHAVGHPDPRPLTDTDRAELRRRRRRVVPQRPPRPDGAG